MLYQTVMFPLVQALSIGDHERAHEIGLFALKVFGLPGIWNLLRLMTEVEGLRTQVAGIRFPNPVGLAAGFDKNAEALLGLQALGFGFLEVGTVTRDPQAGNPRPRMWRLSEDQALINRMGFNNAGVDQLRDRLRSYLDSRGEPRVPVGVNIGRLKETEGVQNAVSEYGEVFGRLGPLPDYFVVNVSSPNTPGLRDLQGRSFLGPLATHIKEVSAWPNVQRPIFIKVSDLTDEQLAHILDVRAEFGNVYTGLIIANTSVERPDTLKSRYRDETGGLSGRPVYGKVNELIRFARSRDPDVPIIGVGGIFDGDDARRMFDAGANLVQLLTGLVYGGPFTPYRIKRYLAQTK